jgi:hypothetical protein
MPINYGSLPFEKSIEAFRDKLNLPTSSWTDIYQGQHARAFVVAGAMKEDILTDFRNIVDKVIAQGMSLEDFRKDFDTIVAKHGWGYNGSRNWRSRVIYETNLYQAHNTGRYAQMQKVKATRPYWTYHHNDAVEHPRPEHVAIDGLTLHADDPYWDYYYPQNGWGCKCYITTHSKRELERKGIKLGEAPAIEFEEKTIGIRGPSPRTVTVPKGIDPGFAYNPGKAAWGQTLSDDVMQQWQQTKGQWNTLTPQGWAEAGRPKQIPLASAPVELGSRLNTQQEVLQQLQKQYGDEKLYQPGGLSFMLNSKTLANHIDPARAEYIPLLDDLLSNPYEVWLSFQQHKGTGKVVIRSRIVKAYDLGKGRYLLAIANVRKGFLESWTFIPTSKRNYINGQRAGLLVYGENE